MGYLERRQYLSDGWELDGHPHERDEDGFCGTCGALRGEPHYRCVPVGKEPQP